jgi:pimeloyl-ACP methyl ester carboxylesterase
MILNWLIAAVVLYSGFVAWLYMAQRSLQYFPERGRTAPWTVGLTEAEEVVLDTADGERVIVWHVPPHEDHSVFLYFHGNGGSLRWRVERFRALTADGNGLVALSYRGYGGSSGRPTETGLMADTAAAYAFAIARYPAVRIVLWGESLGSALAMALAAEKPVGKVVLEAPFTSAVDVGAQHYWFVPVRRFTYLAVLTIGSVLAGGFAFAGSQYDSGVSDTEIKIGNTMPYSGPASAWGMVGKSEAAYFAMINDQGGVNGRKIMLRGLDQAI